MLKCGQSLCPIYSGVVLDETAKLHHSQIERHVEWYFDCPSKSSRVVTQLVSLACKLIVRLFAEQDNTKQGSRNKLALMTLYPAKPSGIPIP